jgi:integral membrane protein
MGLTFSKTDIGRFRLVAISEGISFIILMFIAMPLKYAAGMPKPVTYIGWVHGLLFVLYILALITVKITLNWNFKKTVVAFIASLLPFGTFILDKSLKKDEQAFLATRNEVVG